MLTWLHWHDSSSQTCVVGSGSGAPSAAEA